VYLPSQAEQLYELHETLKNHGMVIVCGDSWTGKTSLLKLLQSLIEERNKVPSSSIRNIKMNSSLLSSHFPNQIDALIYLLDKVTAVNVPDAVNLVVLDGEPSNYLWDVASSFSYLNPQPLFKNQLPL
jgi:ABC-type phosphate/phosphonate transport system ATPase subunit